MDFKSLLTIENLVFIVLFVSKPILLSIATKITISILLKVTSIIFEKTNLGKEIQSFGKIVIRITLWAFVIIMIVSVFGIDTTILFCGFTILMSDFFVVDEFVNMQD